MQIELTDDFFTVVQIELIKQVFGSDEDDEFESILSKVVIAALTEYKEMLFGMGIPSRAADILEYRLFLLIENCIPNYIPSEEDVSMMFQLTPTRSRSLIRSVLTRYRYQLKEKTNETFRDVILNDKNKDELTHIIQKLIRLLNNLVPKN